MVSGAGSQGAAEEHRGEYWPRGSLGKNGGREKIAGLPVNCGTAPGLHSGQQFRTGLSAIWRDG